MNAELREHLKKLGHPLEGVEAGSQRPPREAPEKFCYRLLDRNDQHPFERSTHVFLRTFPMGRYTLNTRRFKAGAPVEPVGLPPIFDR